MSSLLHLENLDLSTQANITTRRSAHHKVKMPTMIGMEEDYKSLLIEDILSQDEANDVITMLEMADELGGTHKLPTFITSTQIIGHSARRESIFPPLSPVTLHDVTHDLTYDLAHHSLDDGVRSERDGHQLTGAGQDHIYKMDKEVHGLLAPVNFVGLKPGDAVGGPTDGPQLLGRCDLVTAPVIDPRGEGVIDPLTQTSRAGPIITTTLTPPAGVGEGEGVLTNRSDESPNDSGDNDSLDGRAASSYVSEALSSDREREEGSENGQMQAAIPETEMADPSIVAAKMRLMEGVLTLLDSKSSRLEDTVKSLEDSLEFSYKEIADLKKENKDLRLLMGSLDTEDKRTQFQVKELSEKLDRVDSVTKKRNLIFEGIPEMTGRREDVDRVIYDVFDQLSVTEGINIDACYRLGPVDKAKPRPILVTFERQADRDMIYGKRMELKKSRDYTRIWINEDVSPASKRKRELIRLISNEARQQGIDCRTGKYALHINRKKFDENNFSDLPESLQPISLKQMRMDANTLAYQSEHAPLSNFFPCEIIIGKHKFFCAEQAFQFLKAKLLNKPLAATRIYLSRDVRQIKQLGAELGTSEEWNTKRFDYMYICLKKKFTQNPELKALLLDTGDLELVEATPDQLWGCGATLSSNVIRRHEWTGLNKHGKILMTVRDELRRDTPK